MQNDTTKDKSGFSPKTNTTKTDDRSKWCRDLAVVKMWLCRGGREDDDGITTGAAWVQKEGVFFLSRENPRALSRFIAFDGDYQCCSPEMDYCYYPDGPKEYIRQATEADLSQPNLVRTARRFQMDIRAVSWSEPE